MTLFTFDTPTPPDTYTLSLHDALPISSAERAGDREAAGRARNAEGPRSTRVRTHPRERAGEGKAVRRPDRKSTRLNSSHTVISYAVFCLKKKKNITYNTFKSMIK